MTKNDLMVILDSHKKWLNDEDGGIRANLRRANLRDAGLRDADLRGANLLGADLCGANLLGADLCGANLYGADLCGANLRRANLRDADLHGANLLGADLRRANLRDADLHGANLYGADLLGADLCGADLRSANLYGADLLGADLCGADLRSADLCGADLRDADLRGAENIPDLPWTSIVPETGSFIGWKKVCDNVAQRSVIIKLEILADAKRCNATGRKCRCSAAKVLEIQTLDGAPAEIDRVVNHNYEPHVTYKVGEIVMPDSFDENRWNECSHGIHFFITRQEAVDY